MAKGIDRYTRNMMVDFRFTSEDCEACGKKIGSHEHEWFELNNSGEVIRCNISEKRKK